MLGLCNDDLFHMVRIFFLYCITQVMKKCIFVAIWKTHSGGEQF